MALLHQLSYELTKSHSIKIITSTPLLLRTNVTKQINRIRRGLKGVPGTTEVVNCAVIGAGATAGS